MENKIADSQLPILITNLHSSENERLHNQSKIKRLDGSNFFSIQLLFLFEKEETRRELCLPTKSPLIISPCYIPQCLLYTLEQQATTNTDK